MQLSDNDDNEDGFLEEQGVGVEIASSITGLKRSFLKRSSPEKEIGGPERGSEEDLLLEVFYTPPSSPKPLYISGGILTKDDENLLNALNVVIDLDFFGFLVCRSCDL